MEQLMADYRKVPMAPADRRVLDYAVKLTRTPGAVGAEDVDALRSHGWSDEAIVNVAMVTAYFNFINRVADGLGIDLEPSMKDRPPFGPCPW